MSGRVDEYREELRRLPDWEAYLRKNSGLPGPRANLELVAAVGEEADADRLWRMSASSDEFLALCGTAGLGRLVLSEPDTVLKWLGELAADSRWRIREGVAMALQRLGRDSMPRLVAEMRTWAKRDAWVQRAAAAALSEPALLKEPEHAGQVLLILDEMTVSLASATDRRAESFRVLRQALGYCWSVAAAAAPAQARPLMEKWLRSEDRDVVWVMTSNLGKSRMSALGQDWVAERSGPRAAAPKVKAKASVKPTVKARTAKPGPKLEAKAKAKPKLKAPAKPKAKARPKPKPRLKPKPAAAARAKATSRPEAKVKAAAKSASKTKARPKAGSRPVRKRQTR